MPQPLDGGGFFRFVAVLRVALVAAEGCLFLSRLDLRLFEMFAVGRYAALGLLGVGARHGLRNQVGGVEGGFGRRLHGGRCCRNSRCSGAAGGGFPFGTVGFFLRVFTRFAAFVPFETRLRMGGGGKARRGFPARQAARLRQIVGAVRQHVDAIDGAGGDTQAAAGTFFGNHRVHQLRRAHNRINRAGSDAGGAAYAGRFVYPCQCFGLGLGGHNRRFAQQAGDVQHHGFPTGGAQIDFRFACRQRARIGQAAVVTAFAALGLRQQAVDLFDGGNRHGGTRNS